VAVIGSGYPKRQESELAYQVGALLAQRGAWLICGGLGGVMEAACKGAKQNGGFTIGILPTATRSDANPYVDLPVVTGMGEARNVIVVSTADAVIAVGGAFGTLSEIAFALRRNMTVVTLNSWKLSNEKPIAGTRFKVARTPEEAVELLDIWQ
jgi:hypothetical protein